MALCAREIARFDNATLVHPRWSPDGRMIALTETPLLGGGNPTSDLRRRQLTGAWEAGGFGFRSGRPALFCRLGRRRRNRLFALRISRRRADGELGADRSTKRFGRPTPRVILRVVPDQQRGAATAWGRENWSFDAGSLRENRRRGRPRRERPKRSGGGLTRGNSTGPPAGYSPDGEWIVFSSDRGINLDLWAVSTRSGAIRRLTRDAADDWDPGFSRTGRIFVEFEPQRPIRNLDGRGGRQRCATAYEGRG